MTHAHDTRRKQSKAQTHNKRISLISHMRGTARGNNGELLHKAAPVSLTPIKGPTLEEIEAKYGK